MTVTLPAVERDAWTLAENAGTDALLRCWTRERGLAVPPEGQILDIPLPASGVRVRAVVHYRSAVGWHHFGTPYLADVNQPLETVSLATLLAREATAGHPEAALTLTDLVARAAESVRRVAGFLNQRRADETPVVPGDAFLEAEQGLLLGHLLHPAPKSRDGICDSDAADWSPELRGSFALEWFAADPAVVRHDAVLSSPALAGRDAPTLMRQLSGLSVAPGQILLPAHPWQARDLLRRPAFRALVDSGAVTPLGAAGPRWYPTSSLRTVYHPDQPVMLKLSLGLRITNSRRENTATELVRGLEVHRLLDAGLTTEVSRAYPGFRIVRDPAWLAVFTPEGTLSHLDVSVREVPPGLTGVRCLAGLVAPRPGIGPSTLAALVTGLAKASGRDVVEVAREWVRRYIDRVLAPMVYLYATTGVGLEAHQQNTLVALDTVGWPEAGWFRDNQGYYLAESGLPGVLQLLAGATSSTLAIVDDAIVDDRLTYYLFFNQALAPVGALGTAGIAPEPVLLAAVRDGLRDIQRRGHDTARGLVERWLTADRLPCKGNLLTRIAGIDEVLAPLDAQSVYLNVPNPLREAE